MGRQHIRIIIYLQTLSRKHGWLNNYNDIENGKMSEDFRDKRRIDRIKRAEKSYKGFIV